MGLSVSIDARQDFEPGTLSGRGLFDSILQRLVQLWTDFALRSSLIEWFSRRGQNGPMKRTEALWTTNN